LASILVEMPEVELFDVNSVDEAANHVVAMTKAISMRLIEEGAAAKYLAGKSKRRSASVALNELLAVEPLQRPELLCPIQALCALPSVGPRSAHALAHNFSSLKGLIEMLEDKSTSLGEKKVMLGNIFSTNGRRVGPKAAQQIVDVFLSEDPYLRFDD
jgi:NAD-dependent DNA ligase